MVVQGRKRAGGWGWRGSKDPLPKRRKANIQEKVTRLQRQVALLKPETKVFQGIFNTANITQAAGLIVHLSPVVVGTGDTNRVGDTIRPSYVKVEGFFSGFGTSINVRFMVVKDTMSNGVLPIIGTTADAILTSFSARSALQNVATRKRFKVIYERVYGIEAMMNGDNNKPYFDSGNLALSGPTTYQTAGGAAIADALKNHYYFLAIVDNADTLDLNGSWEIGFTDV